MIEAEAGLKARRTGRDDALALLQAPDDLDVKIAGAQAEAKVAEAQAAAAQSNATATDLEMGLWGRIAALLAKGSDVSLPFASGGSLHFDTPPDKLGAANLQWNLASQQTWQAHAALAGATAAADLAGQTLSDLLAQRADRQALKAQADAAEAAFLAADAAARSARADLDALLAGAPAEQIQAAAAAAKQAADAVSVLRVQRDQARIYAPEAGIVSSVVLQQGEVAGPGGAIIRTLGLATVTLTLYVPETDLARVGLGGAAQVRSRGHRPRAQDHFRCLVRLHKSIIMP